MLNERGSAIVEAVFGLLFVMLLALGVIQVALSLYARNVVVSSTHEAARAAVELGRTDADARVVALRVIREATGGLVAEPRVAVTRRDDEGRVHVAVVVTGRIGSLGPIPLSIPVRAQSTASGETAVR